MDFEADGRFFEWSHVFVPYPSAQRDRELQ